MASEALDSLLFTIRQHPGFQELLKAVEFPAMPEYKRGDTLEAMGAKSVFASGQRSQHKNWLVVLTGKPEPSQQE